VPTQVGQFQLVVGAFRIVVEQPIAPLHTLTRLSQIQRSAAAPAGFSGLAEGIGPTKLSEEALLGFRLGVGTVDITSQPVFFHPLTESTQAMGVGGYGVSGDGGINPEVSRARGGGASAKESEKGRSKKESA